MTPIAIKGRELTPHKASIHPLLEERNVLTNSPWSFTALWLKRNGKDKALIYWEQAHEFYRAAAGLPDQSAPLVLYYCFMNAVKALLLSEGIAFQEHHGVTVAPSAGTKKSVMSEGIKILSNNGILPSLIKFFQETETQQSHTLREMMFNMVYIHRTYCLSYKSQREMFLPLAQCHYEFDAGRAYFVASLSKNLSARAALKRLPPSFATHPSHPGKIRSVSSIPWSRPDRATSNELLTLETLGRVLRRTCTTLTAVTRSGISRLSPRPDRPD